jgi:hypothetical protein
MRTFAAAPSAALRPHTGLRHGDVHVGPGGVSEGEHRRTRGHHVAGFGQYVEHGACDGGARRVPREALTLCREAMFGRAQLGQGGRHLLRSRAQAQRVGALLGGGALGRGAVVLALKLVHLRGGRRARVGQRTGPREARVQRGLHRRRGPRLGLHRAYVRGPGAGAQQGHSRPRCIHLGLSGVAARGDRALVEPGDGPRGLQRLAPRRGQGPDAPTHLEAHRALFKLHDALKSRRGPTTTRGATRERRTQEEPAREFVCHTSEN